MKIRIRADLRKRDAFERIHAFPTSAADIPDNHEACLVVLSPDSPYVSTDENAAKVKSLEILESRGTSPRLLRNSLVFLAADSARLQELDEALRRFLAWQSILNDVEVLNLDPNQVRQVKTLLKDADVAVVSRIPETYQWLLVPEQETASSPINLNSIRLRTSGSLAERTARRLLQEEMLVADLGPTVLRHHMDNVPLWRGDHVEVRQLVSDFAQYLYLPRVKNPDVVLRAIVDGLGLLTWETETFAFADNFDEDGNRYRGLREQAAVQLNQDSGGLLVKPTVARHQFDQSDGHEEQSIKPKPVSPDDVPTADDLPTEMPSRYHARATLQNTKIGLHASQIAEEVVAHLDGLVGSEVVVTLEIEALVSDGVPEHIQRTVSENSTSLKFDYHAFEDA